MILVSAAKYALLQQNSKTACHTRNRAKYLNNCAEKCKRFICHGTFNKTLLMLYRVSKSPIHSVVLPERGNACKGEKKKPLIETPPMGLRYLHFNTYGNGFACSASFSTDHPSRNGWKGVHGLFHSPRTLPHERRATEGYLSNCYLLCLVFILMENFL